MDDPKQKPPEPTDQGPIGANADGSVNLVPPDQLEARKAEIRAMREAEGFEAEPPGE